MGRAPNVTDLLAASPVSYPHQNGLDVDVYYPRRDHRERPPDREPQPRLRTIEREAVGTPGAEGDPPGATGRRAGVRRAQRRGGGCLRCRFRPARAPGVGRASDARHPGGHRAGEHRPVRCTIHLGLPGQVGDIPGLSQLMERLDRRAADGGRRGRRLARSGRRRCPGPCRHATRGVVLVLARRRRGGRSGERSIGADPDPGLTEPVPQRRGGHAQFLTGRADRRSLMQ